MSELDPNACNTDVYQDDPIIEVNEINDRAAERLPDGSYRYVRTYRFQVHSGAISDKTILDSPQLPAYMSAYFVSTSAESIITDFSVGVVSKRLTRVQGTHTVADVEVIYERLVTDYDPEITIDRVDVEEPLEFDVNGDPIVNAAGDPFDPPIVESRSYMEVHYSYYVAESAYDLDGIGHFNNTCNANAIMIRNKIFAPETLLLRYAPAQRIKQGDLFFYRVTLTLTENPNGWLNKEVINQGYRYLDPNGVLREFQDDHSGIHSSRPRFLTAAGGKLPDSDPITTVTFQVKFSTDFNLLGINVP